MSLEVRRRERTAEEDGRSDDTNGETGSGLDDTVREAEVGLQVVPEGRGGYSHGV
jgi:hypothetical protein